MPGIPTVIAYLVILLLIYFSLMFVADQLLARHAAPNSRTGRYARSAVQVLATIGLLHATFFVLTENLLGRHSEAVRKWYEYSFQGGASAFAFGNPSNYVEHHYLNYALNPQMPYGNSLQESGETD